MNPRRRRGLSLIEMMIATALLAGSALLLQSLIGAGVGYGNRAHDRTQAVSLAELALQEALLNPDEWERERTEPFEHDPNWSYRVQRSPSETDQLYQWKVEIFKTRDIESSNPTNQQPLFTLVHWQRWIPKPEAARRLRPTSSLQRKTLQRQGIYA